MRATPEIHDQIGKVCATRPPDEQLISIRGEFDAERRALQIREDRVNATLQVPKVNLRVAASGARRGGAIGVGHEALPLVEGSRKATGMRADVLRGPRARIHQLELAARVGVFGFLGEDCNPAHAPRVFQTAWERSGYEPIKKNPCLSSVQIPSSDQGVLLGEWTEPTVKQQFAAIL